MVLLAQIAIILIVARLVRTLFVRFHQPAVIGEMVAGLLLGPSLFGWFFPGVFNRVFPVASLPNLHALSLVGLVLFMFIIGLRLRTESVHGMRRTAVVTGAISILVPFLLGAAAATVVHQRLAPAGINTVSFALFMGTAMSITAFPVLARILLERNLFNTVVGRLAIACAAFNDVAGWLILSAVVTLVRAEHSGTIITSVLLPVGYLAVMLWIVRPALGWLAANKGRDFGADAEDLSTAMVVMLLSALATEWLGIHALFGAFFAGLMMPRSSVFEQTCNDRVLPLTQALLLPLFFAFTGLRTEVNLLTSPALWRDAAMFLAVAVVGKGVASALAARLTGMAWREASILGILLNTRGLIELVILNIGLDLGILSPVVFTMMVLMALITTIMTSPLLSLVQSPSDSRTRLRRPHGRGRWSPHGSAGAPGRPRR